MSNECDLWCSVCYRQCGEHSPEGHGFGCDTLVYIKKQEGGAMVKNEIVTEDGNTVMRFKFDSFVDLEEFYLDNYDLWKKQKRASKVIGTVLLVFDK